jgi:homoserine/homoserine lactone efflux protein
MSFDTWIAYIVASSIIAASPGSGAVLSITHSMSYGVKRTSATILGLEIGLVLILFVAGAGVGTLLLASEIGFSLVKILGACYLIYLGWTQWRAVIPAAENNEPGQDSSTRNIKTLSWRQRFLTGFLTNATNPKSIIFMVAVLPQFISHQHPLVIQLIVMACTMVFVDAVFSFGYAFSAKILQKTFKSAKALKIQNRFFGGVLISLGTGLLFVKRT